MTKFFNRIFGFIRPVGLMPKKNIMLERPPLRPDAVRPREHR